MRPKTRKKIEHLDYSLPYWVHFYCDDEKVEPLVDEVWSLFSKESFFKPISRGPKPKSSYKEQLQILILNLFMNWLLDPELKTSVSMTKSYYSRKLVYKRLGVTAMTITLVQSLKSLSLIGLEKGVENIELQTRIWPLRDLTSIFKRSNLTIFDIESRHPEGHIFLNSPRPITKTAGRRGSKKGQAEKMEFEDSDYAHIPQMRKDLEAYNNLLKVSFIDIGTADKYVIPYEYYDEKKGFDRKRFIPLTPHRKVVNRVFIRGTWELGGRFHGGFWQKINEELRAQILINGGRTEELDYSGVHINLCYGLKGKQPPPNEDRYFLPPRFGLTEKEQRDIVKQLALCAINADDEGDAFSATRQNMKPGHKGRKLKNTQLKELLDAFKDKHPLIADCICADKGVELMKIDGNITAHVINHFTEMEVPVLTIHDSYIVPVNCCNELHRVMKEAIAAELDGFKINIDEYGIGISKAEELKSLSYDGETDQERDDFNKELITKVRNRSIKKNRTTEHYWVRKQAHSDWVDGYLKSRA